jgi:hypothetical protein
MPILLKNESLPTVLKKLLSFYTVPAREIKEMCGSAAEGAIPIIGTNKKQQKCEVCGSRNARGFYARHPAPGARFSRLGNARPLSPGIIFLLHLF